MDQSVGSVGQELALLLQTLAERSTAPHPVVDLVTRRPEVVEHAADSVVSWVRATERLLVRPDRGADA